MTNDEPQVEQRQPSLIDALRQQREILAEQRTTLIPIPGYDSPGLLVEYHLLDGHDLERIQRRVFQSTKDRWTRQLWVAVDVMIEAASGVYYTQNGSTEPQPLIGAGDVQIAGYNNALAEMLGLQGAESARMVVIGTFAGRELAIARHSIRLQAWMSGENADVDEEFLGEGL